MCFNGIETKLVIGGQLISKRFLTQLVFSHTNNSMCNEIYCSVTQIIVCVMKSIVEKNQFVRGPEMEG